MKVTISDVAKLAGVSTATVSHTINNTRYVSNETKEKVYRAIEELGYTPDASARSFRTGKKKICLLYTSLSQRGTGIGAARETHSSRRPVSENRRFSIRLFTRRGNSAGRPGRELQAVRLHRGRIPRPGCFNGILGPAPQDRHESRPCPCGQGLLSCFEADGADRAAGPGRCV